MTESEAREKITATFGISNELAYREFINRHYQSLPRQIKIDRADDPQDVVVYEEYVLKMESDSSVEGGNEQDTDIENIPPSLRGSQESESKASDTESKSKESTEIDPILMLVFEDAGKEVKVIEEFLKGGEEITLNKKTLLYSMSTKKIIGMEYLDRIIIFAQKETIPQELLGEDVPVSKNRIVHFDREGNVSVTETKKVKVSKDEESESKVQ